MARMQGRQAAWIVAASLLAHLEEAWAIRAASSESSSSSLTHSKWQADPFAYSKLGAPMENQPSFCDAGEGWEKDWADEFDGDSLDLSSWRVIASTGGTGQGGAAPVSGLDDTACRTAACRGENVRIENGKLILRSQRDESDPLRFSTGAVTTQGKRSWRHDTKPYRLCVRAKLPQGGKGVWPAHWMLPENGKSDTCLDEGEVDIMEMINSDGKVYNTYHWMSSWPKQQCADFNSFHQSVSHQATLPYNWHHGGFHEFAVERTAEHISFAIDGKRLFTASAKTHGFTMSQSPFFLILNTAIGGGWPGEPTASTQMPEEHEIDYVRVVRPIDASAFHDIGV